MISIEQEIANRQMLIKSKADKQSKVIELRQEAARLSQEADAIEDEVKFIDEAKLEKEIKLLQDKLAEIEKLLTEQPLEEVKEQAVEEKVAEEEPEIVVEEEQAVEEKEIEPDAQEFIQEQLKKFYAVKAEKEKSEAEKRIQEAEKKVEEADKEDSMKFSLKNLFKKHEKKVELEAEVIEKPEVKVISGSDVKVDQDPVQGSLHGKAAIDPMFLDRDNLL